MILRSSKQFLNAFNKTVYFNAVKIDKFEGINGLIWYGIIITILLRL